jgi:hypothetical protein
MSGSATQSQDLNFPGFIAIFNLESLHGHHFSNSVGADEGVDDDCDDAVEEGVAAKKILCSYNSLCSWGNECTCKIMNAKK